MSPRAQSPSRVALLIDPASGFNRSVLRGIQEFVTAHGHWVVHTASCEPQILPALREWSPDGVIAQITDQEVAHGLEAWGGPVLNTTSTLEGLPFPRVDVDHDAVGVLAAEHFLQRGYNHFAFFGSDQSGFSIGRERGFRTRLESAGHTVHTCHADSMLLRNRAESWVRTEDEIERWLVELPRPCAIFVSNDLPARTVANACALLGLHVPEELSILSVDNDEFACLFATPTLSSIDIPAFQIGFTAAQQLQQIMQGTAIDPRSQTQLPPVQVIERQSTDIVATSDHTVRVGVAYIRAHFHEQISVDDIADAANCSRRTLERRFRTALQRTVHDELTRQRLGHAKKLLIETEHDLETLAHRSGFTDARRLAVVFRQHFQQSPSDFRRNLS